MDCITLLIWYNIVRSGNKRFRYTIKTRNNEMLMLIKVFLL